MSIESNFQDGQLERVNFSGIEGGKEHAFTRRLTPIDHKLIRDRFRALTVLNRFYEEYGYDIEPNQGIRRAASHIGYSLAEFALALGATPPEVIEDVLIPYGFWQDPNQPKQDLNHPKQESFITRVFGPLKRLFK